LRDQDRAVAVESGSNSLPDFGEANGLSYAKAPIRPAKPAPEPAS
jgi:hypothetical protein